MVLFLKAKKLTTRTYSECSCKKVTPDILQKTQDAAIARAEKEIKNIKELKAKLFPESAEKEEEVEEVSDFLTDFFPPAEDSLIRS